MENSNLFLKIARFFFVFMIILALYILFIILYSWYNYSAYKKYIGRDIASKDIFLKGNNRIFIIFHGFADSAEDLRFLAEKIHSMGYSVYLPNLPGFGRDFNAMSRVKYTDWLKFVIDVYKKYHSSYDKVFVIGFSLGGGLALYLAENQPLEKLIIINPYLQPYTPHFFPVSTSTIGKFLLPQIISPGMKRETRISLTQSDVFMSRKDHISLVVPKSILYELMKLPKAITNNLYRIKSDIYIFSSDKDMVVKKEDAMRIYNSVASKTKKIVHLVGQYHFPFKSQMVMNQIMTTIKKEFK